MNRVIIGLSGLLVAQVALAVGLEGSARGFAGERAQVKLLKVSVDQVSQLSVTGADGKAVRLLKTGKDWVMPGQGGFPADASKVTHLLSDLGKAEEGAPVATSAAAPKRFKVARAAFERKLVLGPEKSPQEVIYLGNSQGVRQVYVRRKGQAGVRLMDFQLYEASTTPDDWINTDVLKVAAPKIAAISWGDVTLTAPKPPAPTASKAGAAKAANAPPAPDWTMKIGDQAATSLPAASVQTLTDQLGSLWIIGLMPETKAPPKGAVEKLDLKVTLRGGMSRDYRLYKLAGKAGGYGVLASNLPRMVTLSDTSATGLIKTTGNKVFAAAQPPASAPAPVPAATAGNPAPAATGGG